MPILLFNLGVSYIVGFLTFFAGCLVPVAPIYVSFLAGSGRFRRNALFFTLGFITVFLFMGLTLNTAMRELVVYQKLIKTLAGLLILVLGMFYLDIFRIPFLERTYMKSFEQGLSSVKTSFLLGVMFSFAWTPCVGPVLASILFLVAVIPNYSRGLPLLIFFALGLATPFIVLGFAMEKFLPLYKKINSRSFYIKKLSGLLLVVFGLLYILNLYSVVATNFFSLVLDRNNYFYLR